MSETVSVVVHEQGVGTDAVISDQQEGLFLTSKPLSIRPS